MFLSCHVRPEEDNARVDGGAVGAAYWLPHPSATELRRFHPQWPGLTGIACKLHAPYAGRMPTTLQVRNVPDRVHRVLRERAARRGRTLSGYVLDELVRLVDEPPIDEWLDEVHRHPPARLRSRVADLVRREREAR